MKKFGKIGLSLTFALLILASVATTAFANPRNEPFPGRQTNEHQCEAMRHVLRDVFRPSGVDAQEDRQARLAIRHNLRHSCN